MFLKNTKTAWIKVELYFFTQNYVGNMSQIILRWHVEEGIIPVPKSVSVQHIRENFDIFDFSLDENDLQAVRSLVPAEAVIILTTCHMVKSF